MTDERSGPVILFGSMFCVVALNVSIYRSAPFDEHVQLTFFKFAFMCVDSFKTRVHRTNTVL